MEGAFFGSIIFEAIGAFFRWIFTHVIAIVKGRKPVSFMRVWRGKKNASLQEDVEYGFSNIVIGVVIVLGKIVVLQFIDL